MAIIVDKWLLILVGIFSTVNVLLSRIYSEVRVHLLNAASRRPRKNPKLNDKLRWNARQTDLFQLIKMCYWNAAHTRTQFEILNWPSFKSFKTIIRHKIELFVFVLRYFLADEPLTISVFVWFFFFNENRNDCKNKLDALTRSSQWNGSFLFLFHQFCYWENIPNTQNGCVDGSYNC